MYQSKSIEESESPSQNIPTHSEIYVYKRSLVALESILQSQSSQRQSFFDYEVLKRRASRCQLAIANFQAKYPDFVLPGWESKRYTHGEGFQTQLF